MRDQFEPVRDPSDSAWAGVRLDRFENKTFKRGRSGLIEFLWVLCSSLLVRSGLPGSKLRVGCLRAFGASIGPGVVIKPYVTVKFPWRLSIGAYSWIGEGVWIDNLGHVTIGSHCCLSQGSYLCTGSHDWSLETFDLIVKPITVGEGAWICAKASLGPGVSVGEGAVLSLGSVATSDLAPWTIYGAGPLRALRPRPRARSL